MFALVAPRARTHCTYYGLNSAFKVFFLHFKTFVCSKCEEMLILLYWPSERTNPVTSHAVVLQEGGALAPKAITKQPFFLKMVTLIMCYIYFFIKMEVIFQNNVNLTDCFISTLRQKYIYYTCIMFTETPWNDSQENEDGEEMKNTLLHTSSTSFSKKGTSFRSSLSFLSINQLSIGIPLESCEWNTWVGNFSDIDFPSTLYKVFLYWVIYPKSPVTYLKSILTYTLNKYQWNRILHYFLNYCSVITNTFWVSWGGCCWIYNLTIRDFNKSHPWTSHLISKGLWWVINNYSLGQISSKDIQILNVVSLHTNTVLTK